MPAAGIQIGCLLLGILMQVLPSSSTPAMQSAPHAPSSRASEERGFLGYTLGRLNPDHRNYGSELRCLQNEAVHNTLDDLYFWSDVFSILLLGTSTTLFILHLRSADKKEIIVASLIAELWNRRISDGIEIEKRTQEYNLLIDKLSANLSSSSSPVPGEQAAGTEANTRTQEKIDRLLDGSRVRTKRDSTTPSKRAAVPLSQESSSGEDGRHLRQENLRLENQVEALLNQVQNLKERLNQSTAFLDQERKRNQALKGA